MRPFYWSHTAGTCVAKYVSYTSTTSQVTDKRPLKCHVCGNDLTPGSPYRKKAAHATDEQGGASSAPPRMEYFHLDGGACRPNEVEENSTMKCSDFGDLAVDDVAGDGDADFMNYAPCFYTQRADVLRAGHELIIR